MRVRIPKENRDVRRAAFMRNFKRITFFLLYAALWALGYLFYLSNPNNKPFEWWAMLVFCVLVAASGFFIFNIGKFLTEKSFVGIIKSMSVSRTYGRGVTRDGRFKIDYHTYRVLKITDSKGKKRKLKFQLFDDGYDLYYREGDTVTYFRGTTYPLSLEAEERGEHICLLCGVRAIETKKHGERQTNTEYCEACGKGLVKISSLEKLEK